MRARKKAKGPSTAARIHKAEYTGKFWPHEFPKDGAEAARLGWERKCSRDIVGPRIRARWEKAHDAEIDSMQDMRDHQMNKTDPFLGHVVHALHPPERITHDEVWISKDGTRTEVQDLDLSHAHNIIRMILRGRRQRALVHAQAAIRLAGVMGEFDGSDDQ